VTVDASLSCSLSLASEVDSNDSQNTSFHRQYRDTKPPSYYEVHRAASARDVQFSTEEEDDIKYVALCSDSEEDIEDDISMYNWTAYSYTAGTTHDNAIPVAAVV
jgi:hypothetical protein